jgi:hypothetical protein
VTAVDTRGSDLRIIRILGGCLAATFAVVGLIFLIIPGRVLSVFNSLAGSLGWPASPTAAFTLYLALAVGYMYVVTVLAWQMARRPQERIYPWVLVQAKAASALVCIGLFVLQAHYLIYLVNFVVDATIAALVWWVCLRPSLRSSAR